MVFLRILVYVSVTQTCVVFIMSGVQTMLSLLLSARTKLQTIILQMRKYIQYTTGAQF